MKKFLCLSAVITFMVTATIAFADEYYCNIEQGDIIKTFIYNPVAGNSCERIKRIGGSEEAYNACVQKNAIEKQLYEENTGSCPKLYRKENKFNGSFCSVRYVTEPQAKIYNRRGNEECVNVIINDLKADYPNIE